MSRTLRRRRPVIAAAVLTATLALSPVGIAQAAPASEVAPSDAAAAWLTSALVDGQRLQSEFGGTYYDAPGATADAVFALAAAGRGSTSIERATDWLETQVTSYTGSDGEVYSGAVGKLLLVAATTGRDARDFGGVDLVAKVQALEVTDPDTEDEGDLLGRFRDVSAYGDFSTPLTHSLVLLGLQRTGGSISTEAVEVLLDQQCANGGFSGAFLTSEDQACTPSVDTTGYAVQALQALGQTAAVADAVDWLESVQGGDGSFGSADGRNSNSTGLAAVALAVGGGDADAIAQARAFITSLQDDCDGAEPGAIPFSASSRGFVAMSTAQALPGLVGVSLAQVTASGASAEVVALDCPVDSPRDDAADEVTEDDAVATRGEGRTAGDAPARPSRIDAGLSPSNVSDEGALAGLLGLAGALVLLAGAALARRRDAA